MDGVETDGEASEAGAFTLSRHVGHWLPEGGCLEQRTGCSMSIHSDQRAIGRRQAEAGAFPTDRDRTDCRVNQNGQKQSQKGT